MAEPWHTKVAINSDCHCRRKSLSENYDAVLIKKKAFILYEEYSEPSGMSSFSNGSALE